MNNSVAANNKPEEMIRQGNRVNEQFEALKKIIGTIQADLVTINEVMKGYDDNIIIQLGNLGRSLDNYQNKSSKIYKDVANTLINYGENLRYNINDLTESIERITAAINSLP